MADINATAQRHLFIDLYRTAVIILMLEGHVVRVCLAPYRQQMWLFQIHEFFHGLSAPAFLFGAGLTFIISTRKRWREYHHWSQPLARRIGRSLLIVSLGLMLHLPFFSFRKIIIDGTTTDYLQLFQCDVLDCIGIGLLSLHVILFFFTNEKYFYGLVLSTIITVCFLTPTMWNIDTLHYLPLPFAQLVNGSHGSPFPMFPYIGFLYAGVIVSWEFLAALRHGAQKLFMLKLAVIGSGLIAFGMISDALPLHIYPHEDFWHSSPSYFLIRIGSLMLTAAGFWYLSMKLRNPNNTVTVLGRESLFVYVLHLIFLYGAVMNDKLNLRSYTDGDMGFGGVTAMFVAFTGTLFVLASFWSFVKKRHTYLYHLVQLTAGGIFLYFFFTRDF